MQSVGGSEVFAKVNMDHAYWQLPLADELKELMSIQTLLGVYASNRLLQGATAGNHFQAVSSEAFSSIATITFQLIHDCMLYAEKEDNL